MNIDDDHPLYIGELLIAEPCAIWDIRAVELAAKMKAINIGYLTSNEPVIVLDVLGDDVRIISSSCKVGWVHGTMNGRKYVHRQISSTI